MNYIIKFAGVIQIVTSQGSEIYDKETMDVSVVGNDLYFKQDNIAIFSAKYDAITLCSSRAVYDAATGSTYASAELLYEALIDGEYLNASSVSIASGSTIKAYGSITGPIQVNFNRPADTNAYAAGDVIADSTSAPTAFKFASLFPSGGGSGYVHVSVDVSNRSSTNRMIMHMYSSLPTLINDNAAFSMGSDFSKWLGTIEFDNLKSGTTNALSKNPIKTTGTDIWFIIVTPDAYTPASGTTFRFNAYLDANQ